MCLKKIKELLIMSCFHFSQVPACYDSLKEQKRKEIMLHRPYLVVAIKYQFVHLEGRAKTRFMGIDLTG